MARNRAFVLSAQQVDPLSWFTGPLVPLAFAVVTFGYGSVMSALTWSQTEWPWLQPIAVVLSTSSGIITHIATRPVRNPLGWSGASIAIAPAIIALIVSAAGYARSDFSIELWWAPGGLAIGIASLAPYLPVRKVAAVGGTAAVLATVAALAIVHPTTHAWGPVGTAVIIGYPAVLATAATAMFSYAVVDTMLPMLESPSRIMVVGQRVKDEAARHVEHVTVAQLTARAAPFLEDIAERGTITPSDRALAGQLARRLRDELVTQSNLSWLDSIASESRLVVVDPDRLAQRMNNAQRTALRGMLRAAVDTPGIDSSSLMVELRSAPDGSTAVGVSLDMALPEGRRIMHLAPYYLTLKTAFADLEVDQETLLKLTFRAPRP